MATAILDFELSQIPPTISVSEQYRQALILLRLNGYPISRVTVPVVDGQISKPQVREAVSGAIDRSFCQRYVNHYLNWDQPYAASRSLPKATVAVTTRDRPQDLKRCLDALMQLPDDGQEILVIDNCPSTDETAAIVAEYPRVRYVREDYPGSSAARNRALREAKYDIVAFTDDDAMPDARWLRALLYNFTDPLVLCVTGLVMPLELENEAQEWFEKFTPMGRGFSRLVFDGVTHSRFRVAAVGVSANMALHRKVLEDLGAFDEALGVGTPTRCGEDHELFSRILAKGYKIIYEPAALSWHRHRRTWEETRKAHFGYGVGVYAFWTRCLLVEKDFGVVLMALGWLFCDQLPNLLRSLFRQTGSVPFDLLLAEIRGCLIGPWSYLVSRKQFIANRQSL